MKDLGTLGGSKTVVNGVNSKGQVIGYSYTNGVLSNSQRAFLWENGEMKDLGTLGGDTSCANDINERGQIVGWAYTLDGVKTAFLYENGITSVANSITPKISFDKAKYAKGDKVELELSLTGI